MNFIPIIDKKNPMFVNFMFEKSKEFKHRIPSSKIKIFSVTTVIAFYLNFEGLEIGI